MHTLRLIWYFIVWSHVKNGLRFYFSKILVSGRGNVPENVPVIFASNHENALIDPLIITTRIPKMIHYLVTASVFKNPIIRKFLMSLNLMPVYRMRDGARSILENKQIFKNCFDAFCKGESLMLFPEAAHEMRRVVKHAKKGIGRIALGAMNVPNAPDELYIVPVGINYSAHKTFRSVVHVVYGKPIKVENIPDTKENIEKLVKTFDNHLKLYHVSLDRENILVLDKVFFHDQSPYVPLEPGIINQQAKLVIENLTKEKEETILNLARHLESGGMKFPFERIKFFFWNAIKASLLAPFGLAGMIVHAPLLLLGWYIMKGIKDKAYLDTIYYGVGLVIGPLIWTGIGVWVWSFTAQVSLTIISVTFIPLTLMAYNSMKRNWHLFYSNLKLFRSIDQKANYEKFRQLIQSVQGE